MHAEVRVQKVGLTIKKKKEKQKTYRNKHTNLRLIFMESSDSEFGLLIEDPYLGFRFTVLILTIACEKQQIQLAGRNHKGARTGDLRRLFPLLWMLLALRGSQQRMTSLQHARMRHLR